MTEARVTSSYFLTHSAGVVTRMEDFAATRAGVVASPRMREAARLRFRGQERLVAQLTAKLPIQDVVAAGLRLVAERYPGAGYEPFRVNVGLALLGTAEATTYIADQTHLLQQTLAAYEHVKQVASRSYQVNASSLAFDVVRDPALDNELRIGLNLRRLRHAVAPDTQQRNAVEQALRG